MNIMKLFFEEPTREFNIREVGRLLRISPATASKELKKLAGESLLKVREQKVFRFYRADLDSEEYRDKKAYYNIRKVKECGLIERLNRFYLKPTIVLFGSAATGMDTETSDIDLLVISENPKEFPGVKIFEKKLNRKLQLFVVKDVKDLKNEYLINNVMNGTTLQGVIKWI